VAAHTEATVTVRVWHPLFGVHPARELVLRAHADAMLSLVQAHAAAHGWTTARHGAYATTGLCFACKLE
jgi:hypothetical protein